jgi:hypothetical protein
MISGNSETSLQASVTLIPTIFSQILKKELAIPFEVVSIHLQLWKDAMEKRGLESKLLICLNQWISLPFEGQKFDEAAYKEKLQIFRGHLLKLRKESRINPIRTYF